MFRNSRRSDPFQPRE
jgi:hypothetical protein